MTSLSSRPIGIFDSGVGGLTVYRALREALPNEDFIYLGDTARLPYGTKSAETVARYALQAARRLREDDIKLLVVACNTASAQGLPHLRTAMPDLPCLGVIEPGAAAAAKASTSGPIVVMATEGTVRSGAYTRAIHHHRPEAQVQALACNLLVAVAEEGWCEGTEAEAIVQRYRDQIANITPEILVLGCTHFPLLAATIRKIFPPTVTIIDSATATARAVREDLNAMGLATASLVRGRDRFLVTDAPDRFQQLAARFLPTTPITAVETVEVSWSATASPDETHDL